MREATQLESQETEKRLSLNNVDADSRVKASTQAERFRLQEAERQLIAAAWNRATAAKLSPRSSSPPCRNSTRR